MTQEAPRVSCSAVLPEETTQREDQLSPGVTVGHTGPVWAWPPSPGKPSSLPFRQSRQAGPNRAWFSGMTEPWLQAGPGRFKPIPESQARDRTALPSQRGGQAEDGDSDEPH